MRPVLEAPYFSATGRGIHERIRHPESRATLLHEDINRRLERMSKGERARLYTEITEEAYHDGLVLPGQKIPMVPVPVFFDKERMLAKASQVEKVHHALAKVEDLALSEHPVGKRILEYVTAGMSPIEKDLLLQTEPALSTTRRRRNTRFDTFYNPQTNHMSIIEGNTTNPEGLLYHHILAKSAQRFMEKLGHSSSEFDQTDTSAAHQVVSMFKDEYAERKKAPLKTLAAIYETDDDVSIVNRAEIPRLAAFFKSFGIDLQRGAPTDVQTRHGKIFVHGHEVDALWRNAVDLEKAYYEAPGFIDVLTHPSRYVILNDDGGRLMGSKTLLGELHDPKVQQAARLTREEIAAINEIVPFTFDPKEVQVLEGPSGEQLSPREYLKKFRDHFVLKPSSGTHGEEVHFGINNGTWDIATNTAVTAGGFVAQRYIPYESITFSRITITPEGDLGIKEYIQDTNVHVINGRAVGTSICRAVPKMPGKDIKILNVAGGGGLQPSLTV